jgi:hypothetical protein
MDQLVLLSSSMSLWRLDDMFDFDLAAIAFYSPILMLAQEHEIWIQTGKESLNMIHVCSLRLSNLFIEFYRGG